MAKEIHQIIYVNSNEVTGDQLSDIRATADNDDIYANIENTKVVETRDKVEHQQSGGTQRSRAVAVCLGVLCFLLLAGIIGLLVYYGRLTGLHDSEMQRVRTLNGNLTEDYSRQQTSYANLTERFNLSQKEVDRLHRCVNAMGGTQRSRAVAVCLGVLCFLLLAGIIGLLVYYGRLIGLHDSEMQRVRTLNGNLTEDYSRQQSSYANLTERFNLLQKEVDRLHRCVNAMENCPSGWKTLGCSCYWISAETKTWEESRQHCQSNGADLVIINSREELHLLLNNQKLRAWIGLSDQTSEGTWQWVDGTVLQGEGFWMRGEPNDHKGIEDCVELSKEGTWNDMPCNWKLNWICEVQIK